MSRRTRRRILDYAAGIAAPAVCTALAWPLGQSLGPASVLMTYLLGVFLVAARHGRGASILASLLSAAAFAYFSAPPIFSLAVADPEQIINLGVMLLVANVTSNLVERVRLQAAIATRRERQAAALYRLSEALSGARSEADVVVTAVRHLEGEFSVPAVLLFPDEKNRVRYPLDVPLPMSLRSADLSAAQRVFERGGADAPGAEDGARLLPIEGSAGILGVLAMGAPHRRQPADRVEKAFLDTFQNQIGQSLDRLRLAERAREASIQAEAEALRNALLSAISHDLRTPLTRIVGTASMLAGQDDSLTPGERREFAVAIQEEGQRMADLMSKILDMARLTTGKIVLRPEWNTLEEIVGGTLARLDTVLRGRPVGIRLPGDLPLVRVDAVLLQQVLMNLIDNAIKYTPAGSPIEITADCQKSAMRIVVADRGPGIAEGLRSRLFEKFQRLAPESAQSGVGLGLALCRAIMEAHGGAIGVEPRPGGGALFVLTLPLHEQPPTLAWDDTPEPGPCPMRAR